MSTFTTTKQLEQVARGADVGVWDTPENSNWGIVDSALGGITTISLNNSNVILSAAQFQSKELTFNSTLTGNVAITFPTSFTGPYTIQNLCTGSSAFTITLNTTSGGQAIGCPLGEIFDIWNDGVNIKFRNFGRVGTYWDYAGSSVPSWVSACTVAPYLNCNGASFSSSTYPALTIIFGGTVLPDARGSVRATLNQGTGRLTLGGGGVNGDQLFAGGGNEFMQSHTHGINDPTHTHGSVGGGAVVNAGGSNIGSGAGWGIATGTVPFAPTGISIIGTGAGGSQNVQPSYIGGLTLIRAG